MTAVAEPRIRPPVGQQRYTVLVIDDSNEFRQYLRKFLELVGLNVIAAAKNSDEGLRLAREQKPDLIFLDLCLGLKSRLSGNATLRALKTDDVTRIIPVIVMSGIKESPEDEVGIRRDGADEFLTKDEFSPQGKSFFLRRISALLMLNRNEIHSTAAPLRNRELFNASPFISGPVPGLIFTLLVIDDEEEAGELIKTIFSNEPSYRILSASSGAQGLRMAANELPDLIILDLLMPGMSGQEVCRRLREQGRTFYLPILILSGDLRTKQEVQCLNLGADDYLVKPVNPSRLMARVRGLIRRQRLRGNSRGIIRIGMASLDTTTHRLGIGEQKTILLTPLESGICALLMSAEGKSIEKKVLHKKIYNSWPPLRSASIKVHIGNIRKKLGNLSDLVSGHNEQGYGFNVEYANRAGRQQT